MRATVSFAIAGFLTGIIGGLFGVGGGEIFIPLLIYSSASLSTRHKAPHWPFCFHQSDCLPRFGTIAPGM